MGAVFESMESWKSGHPIPAGGTVVTADMPQVVQGYLMVPILPSGAVELALFREVAASEEVCLSTDTALQLAAAGKTKPNVDADSQHPVRGRKHRYAFSGRIR